VLQRVEDEGRYHPNSLEIVQPSHFLQTNLNHLRTFENTDIKKKIVHSLFIFVFLTSWL
jgi:hypothetical protein